MTRTMTTLLVGAHFRPPARQVIECLPSGLQLDLEPEPENPYDPGAVRVMLAPGEIPASSHSLIDEAIQGTGTDLADLLSGPPLRLGYLAKTGGKPLAGALDFEGHSYVGNVEILEAMTDANHQARLGFAGDGKPLVIVTIGGEI